jgi:lipoprotein-anchoring transpeptidase ErfK/SrfK
MLPFQGVMAAPTPSVIWLSVDTQQLSLAVMRGDTELHLFENIAIGSRGSALERQMGDQTTPLGDFIITEIRHSERFELFMAFDYPNLDHTERAFEDKRIDAQEYRALRYDLDRGNTPPQGTSLGGNLGIHGIGDGDKKIHESINWTDGCIAINNEQLMELADWVEVGTRVNVH